MPRSANQKLKLLYLKDFFEEKTDEKHPATMDDILKYLKTKGVEAERKSIYSDLDALEDYGMELRDDCKERNKKYRLLDRYFQPSEVKMIIDSVAASKSLSEEKSLKLIEKLGTLVSEHQRKELKRQVKVSGRAKTTNQVVLYNVDAIHAAIEEDKTITFEYYHYNAKKEREKANGGEPYEVSPWYLIDENGSYYLLSYYDGNIRWFRVDRMKNVEEGKKKREGREQLESFDPASFTKQSFGMFQGKKEKVEMIFHNSLIDTVIDKFGKDVWLTTVDDSHVKITVTVAVSQQFFGWVFGLGGKATIVGPKAVVKKMKDMLGSVSERYE